MSLRPDGRDLRIIGFYLGKIAMALALMMALPLLVAVPLGEWDSATALLAGVGIAAVVWQMAEWRLQTRASLTWAHGTVVVALAWLVGSLLAAVPLFLSGHFGDFLDAWFEAMSGLTTSGLSVVQDVDHLSYSMNFYRHLTHFAGGQGIVIVALSLFTAGGAQIGTLYVAEGRDERIVPSVVRTARFIYLIAGAYLLAGTLALFAAMSAAGLGGWRGLWHAVNIFFAAFDTGGFSPYSSSIAYYHSLGVESVVMVLMVAGTMSFALHYALWNGRHRELLRNLEVRTITLTLAAFSVLALYGLARAGTYTGTAGLFRKGFFTMLSAHSGTGFAVNAGTLYVTDWGVLAPAAVVAVMALGGMAGSTAGGIKALRIGLTVKGLLREVERLLRPESAVTVATYHSGKRRILQPPALIAATTVLLLYVLTYLAGALVGLLYGQWEVTETIFESVSAAANVGLSVGITGPDMPRGLQVTYLLQMWLGRLEFMAAFALVGYGVSLVGRRR
ncbi:TrkH family potassium uptake protein [Egicoccus halophilus]|uniref:Potassium transporter n=1 Tax=Egicoccus halophilus TaxID=1670830 RepID=A0A8J3AGJ1_9ACTN|nr:potassium transporter TrkG [Egicoccus halophilus]GGI08917.1 potassium transporter [Egicoccus halophilus]